MIMGILDRIKSIFVSEKDEETRENPLEEADLTDVDAFLDKKNDEIGNLLKERKNILFIKLSPLLERFNEDILRLDSVNVDKIKSDERLRKVTKEGKENYIVSLNQFLEYLKNLLDKNEEYEIGDINRKLDAFSRNSFKSYHKATVLIGKEIEKIKDDIIKIKRFESDFMKDNSELIKKGKHMRDLIEMNADKKDKEKSKNELSGAIRKIEQVYGSNKKELLDIEEKISKIEKGFEYQERERLTREKKEKEDFLKEAENDVKALFDRRILEKYVHSNREDIYAKIAQEYIEDPNKAMLLDEEMKIFNVLDYIREKIRSKELMVKESDKALEKIGTEIKTLQFLE